MQRTLVVYKAKRYSTIIKHKAKLHYHQGGIEALSIYATTRMRAGPSPWPRAHLFSHETVHLLFLPLLPLLLPGSACLPAYKNDATAAPAAAAAIAAAAAAAAAPNAAAAASPPLSHEVHVVHVYTSGPGS